jgi:hypothetical protein
VLETLEKSGDSERRSLVARQRVSACRDPFLISTVPLIVPGWIDSAAA